MEVNIVSIDGHKSDIGGDKSTKVLCYCNRIEAKAIIFLQWFNPSIHTHTHTHTHLNTHLCTKSILRLAEIQTDTFREAAEGRSGPDSSVSVYLRLWEATQQLLKVNIQ